MLPSEVTTTSEAVGSGVDAAIYVTFAIAWAVLVLIAGWKLYVKAGQQGWVAIIPIVNMFGLLKIVKRPLWWFLLLLIPFVNLIVGIILLNDLSKAFGKGIGMTLLLIFFTPIGYLVLGFGDARYQLPKEPLFG